MFISQRAKGSKIISTSGCCSLDTKEQSEKDFIIVLQSKYHPKVICMAWGASTISWTQAVLLSLARNRFATAWNFTVIIWSRLKSQSLGSELGQHSSSMYLDLTAHTNQSGSEKLATCQSWRIWEILLLQEEQKKNLQVGNHSFSCQTLPFNHYYSQTESWVSAQQSDKFCSFRKTELKKKKKKEKTSPHPGLWVVLINNSADVWELLSLILAVSFSHWYCLRSDQGSDIPLCLSVWYLRYENSNDIQKEYRHIKPKYTA